MLTTHAQYHSRANTDHLHVPRKDVGRGLMQEESAYIAEITKLMEYVESKIPIRIVRTYQHSTNSKLFQTDNFKKPFQSKIEQIKHDTSEHKGKMGRKKDVWTISMQLRRKLMDKKIPTNG
jgi:hypothetical protein